MKYSALKTNYGFKGNLATIYMVWFHVQAPGPGIR
jgi:hypothetical protein